VLTKYECDVGEMISPDSSLGLPTDNSSSGSRDSSLWLPDVEKSNEM